jgi:hypothetical protein
MMTVSPSPGTRRRLADFMEERRLELGLRWQEVADAAAAAGFRVSLKTLHSVRAGTSDIRPMTQRGIEAGLRWERGSVSRILDGGAPLPAGEDEPTLPGVTPAAGMDPDTAMALQISGYIIAERNKITERVRREIEEARHRGVPDDQIFTEAGERAVWAIPLMGEDARVARIAALRRMPRTGSGDGPVELAGLEAAWGAVLYQGDCWPGEPVLAVTGDRSCPGPR